MMNKTLHIFSLILLLTGVVANTHAQTINGNIYGGGEKAKVDGTTNVTINKGHVGADIFGGGEGTLNNDGTPKSSADVSSNTNVTINGGEFAVKHIDAHDPRIRTDFAEHYNIYGGGNIASNVGNTHVYVKRGMISKDSDGSGFGIHNDGTFLQNSNPVGIGQAYYHEGQMYFCIFGGGYGKNTSVTGDTWVDFNISGMVDINSTAIEDDLLEYQSYLDVIGGGFNGTVKGNTNVHVGGNAMCRNVYGGGLYAAIGTQGQPTKGKTNVHITGGNVDNVYGGGVMGDILTSTNVNIGLHDNLNFDYEEDGVTPRTYEPDNNKITVLMSVFGGNDVSGRVETANVNHYGGTIDQDIYGAGNGNYRGYYTPGVCDYADGDNDNYYPVDHSGETSQDSKGTKGPKGNTYKGRPQTGNVNITIAGNSTTDKASVLGQVFGGGNSCTVGAWETNLSSKYYGDPHKWRDDPEYFLGGGELNVTVGSHVKIGRSRKELVEAGDEEYLNKDGENVSGLFMGCSGKYLATQDTAEDDYVYHHYYDRYTAKYWPGFAVFADNGTPLSRAEGLAAYNAYLNNILIWSDNVTLTIDDEAEDIWLANFVGGGFRGSMKAKTEDGRFAYTLPEGVTIGNAVVGGAYNTDVVYRVFDTEDDMHTYKTTTIDGKTHYLYRTTLKPGWVEGRDYHHVEYAEDGETITGIVRFYYDGGMLSHNNSNARIHQVHADPRADEDEYATAYFEPMNEDSDDPSKEDEETRAKLFSANKDKSFVYLNLRCALEPEVLSDSESNHSVHGGNVFGGCFMSGLVQGDSWVDYGAWLSPNCTNTYYFDKTNNMHIYSEAADLVRNNALNVFGAGYGENTHTAGDTYLYIKAVAQVAGGDGNKNGKFPYMFNAFGGSYAGRVYGNTNVYYASGKQGTLLGSLYGGGYKGDIDGNTFVELAEGFVTNVYGGSRQANIGGAAHVWAYDGKSRGIDDANHLIICNLYGGNDIAGTIRGTMPAKFTEGKWDTAPTGETLSSKQFNSYVEISADDGSANRGFPLVGSAYAGGNGVNWAEDLGTQPTIATALLEIDGGSTLRAFGGGNMATVTGATYIFTNASSTEFADVTFSEYQTNIMEKVFFNGVTSGYQWMPNSTDGKPTRLVMDKFHVDNLFGGNNLATMDIQPTWNLKKGKIENVYSGGNMGDMTYYNATPASGKSKGLSLTIDSDNITIQSLYGGCRMSDVKAMNGVSPVTFEENDYGATVNIKSGNIGNVYGGNDVSGYVYNGTNVNLSGSITGNVYGAGNGDYLYAYDKDGSHEFANAKEIIVEKDSELKKLVYWVKGDKNVTPLQQLLALNNVRPHVEKAYLNIQGTNATNKVYIHGSVYCGGNSSTIRPVTDGEHDAHVKFNIGDNVIVNEVFMGSNGASLKYDAHNQSNTYLTDFEKINKLNLATDEVIDWSVLNNDNTPLGDKELINGNMDADLRDKLYPNLLSVYMRAVDMKAMPIGFDGFSSHNFTNTWIGTFCMGGNAGSMMTDQPVDIVFPQSLNFFGRIIGGSKDASFQYKGKWHRGGFRMPLADDAELDDAPTKTKLRMKIRGDWYSRRMVIDDNYQSSDYLAPDKTDDGKTWNPTGKAWGDGCNVYGGCYQSGDMVGDVQIYIESDMLAYSRYVAEGGTIDDYEEPSLDQSNKLNLPVANVYGAGYGPESRSYGDAYIYMKDIPNVDEHTHPSVNNIFGGGRNGMLIGNSVIHVHDGLVYKDVVGGSFAAPMYGSAQVTVGYPKFYVCKKSGEYFIDRADKWNEGYMTKGAKGPESVIKKSIKYFEGTYVPCNVYDQITSVKLHGSDDVTDLSSIHTTPRADNDYFTFHDEGLDASVFPEGGWNSVEIRVRGGVYGGGFSLSNSTSAVAGSYTTLASTKEYNHGTDSEGNSSIGYGGNSSIIISDFLGELADDQEAKDHIKISTETTQKDNGGNVVGEYTGVGGIYGDGRLVFCEGFRAAELNGYGYAASTPSNPLMLNSLQRLDLLTINDCCFKLYGDEDFATDEINKRRYSLARIGELCMNSSIAPTSTYATGELTSVNSRNYIGFYNTIHYIGAIVTNDDFHSDKFHDHTGLVDNENTYHSKKQWYIDQYHGENDEASVNAFKQRNYATARNMVGINSGYCLRVENQYYEGEEGKIYYGPIVGVAEVKLLNVQQGEGGGYVYADNVHADTYDKDNPKSATFMNESGNFVFEGVHRPGDPVGEKQFIVDDCLPTGFDEVTPGEDLPEQHYWYVIGDTYYYNTTLTAYSYNGTKTFDLIKTDPNIIFADIEKNSEIQFYSMKWLPQTSRYPDGYTGDVRGERDAQLTALPGSDDKYKFTVQVGDGTWSDDMPRSTDDDTEVLTEATRTAWNPYTKEETAPNPRFNVRLLDNVNNCPQGSEEEYFNDHLRVPEKVQLIIKARKPDGTDSGGNTVYETKTFNVTLEIIYIQGPSFTGNVNLTNCALPGEHIGFNSKDIQIKTTEKLPVTGFGWRLVSLERETYNDETHKMEYKWQDAQDGTIIPEKYYHATAEGYLEGSIPALNSQNHWNIYYTFKAGGETFTVITPTTNEAKPLGERMLVVHNYHKMADIVNTKYDVTLATGSNIYAKALKQGAKIYLADAADITAFVNYINAGNTGEGLHFYLQNELTLPAAITGTFAGTLHGDGYSIKLPSAGSSLFGNNFDKDHAKVYNLGVTNGTITTVTDASTSVINSFDSNNTSDNLLYGKTAYNLSHYFTADNDESQRDSYVHTYYANNDGMGGDWRYARTASVDDRCLRNGDPKYGQALTNHNTSHSEAYTIVEHDYLFFGQSLNPTGLASTPYPQHIDDTKVITTWTETNRVYETEGYYRSGVDQKFYYNTAAWALQPSLTAVRFDNTKSSTEGEQRVPTSFGSSSADDTGKALGFQHVTRNLLVYEADNVTKAAGSAAFHHVKGSKGATEPSATSSVYTCANLALEDKEEFWAPYSFTATKASYERLPLYCAESNNSAWEGICLPFTVKKVEASTNGEITHFYGEPKYAQSDVDKGLVEQAKVGEDMLPEHNDKTLHHEYWLRGFVSIGETDGHTTATFQRPGTEAGLFSTAAQTAAAFDYSYAANDYLTGQTGYNKTDNSWYTTAHEYTDYTPLTANTPYIICFPGNRYYEFNLTDQTITFSNDDSTEIPVTSSLFTTADSYNHVGTFLHCNNAAFGMNDEGTGFDSNNNDVLPFRTYITAMSLQEILGGEQLAKHIFIGSFGASKQEFIGSDEEQDNPDDGISESHLHIYPKDNRLIIDSTSSTTVLIHTIGGRLFRILDVRPGLNTYSGFPAGVYIAGGKKVRIN